MRRGSPDISSTTVGMARKARTTDSRTRSGSNISLVPSDTSPAKSQCLSSLPIYLRLEDVIVVEAVSRSVSGGGAARYQDKNGRRYEQNYNVRPFLLSRYVVLLHRWILHHHRHCQISAMVGEVAGQGD